MKWIAAVALSLALLALTACGGQKGETGANTPDASEFPVTMQQILDANRTDVLVARRDSFLMTTTYDEDSDTSGIPICSYADSEMVYLETDLSQELHTEKGAYLYMDRRYGPPLTPSPLTLDDFSELVMDEDLTLLEEIVSVTEEDDGRTLVVKTVLSADAIASYYGPELESIAYEPGNYSQEEYTLDAADLAVLSETTTLCQEDGTALNQAKSIIAYGVQRPEGASILLNRLEAPDRRTVTIVMDPGTEQEESISVSPMRGDQAFAFLPEGYYALYKDPACQEIYEDDESDYQSDVTLYARYLDPADGLNGFLSDMEDESAAEAPASEEANAENPASEEANAENPASGEANAENPASGEEEDLASGGAISARLSAKVPNGATAHEEARDSGFTTNLTVASVTIANKGDGAS